MIIEIIEIKLLPVARVSLASQAAVAAALLGWQTGMIRQPPTTEQLQRYDEYTMYVHAH